MKIFTTQKFFIACLLSTLIFPAVNAQETQPVNAYLAEDKGYFTNPTPCSKGILLTDNYRSKIWLLSNGQLTEVAASAGCGNYFNVGTDGHTLAYKRISAEGMQSPVLIDLSTGTVTVLHEATILCGQPQQVGNTTVYSIGNEISITQSGKTKLLQAGYYTNIIRIAPDEHGLVCNDEHDRIVRWNLATDEATIISPENFACFFPQWSPDSKKILYTTSGNQMMIFDGTTGQTFSLGYGLNPQWAPTSDAIVFHRIESQNEKILNSDLWISTVDGGLQKPLTTTAAICEMDASFISNGEIVYHTYTGKKIGIIQLDAATRTMISNEIIYGHVGDPDMLHYNTSSFATNRSIVTVPGTVPYIHQVYDTPSWHYGYGSCAPTAAMMAIAYFNKLPKWPITCGSPTSHTSDYGSYVADKYRFNEIYYSDVATTGGGEDAWGGYGFMWTGSKSPNGDMNQYMVNHQMSSTEYWTSGCKWDSTLQEINNGHPQPICSLITASGHLTLAIGYVVGQHTLIFNDPYGNKNNGYMNYAGQNAYYDWPGYSNGFSTLSSIAWTVQSRTTETTYNDTIIDDIYYNHGFEMQNQGTALMRYYRDKSNAGYNNHYWYTYSSPSTTIDTCRVKWTPTLPQRSMYEVLVYIPSTYATATTAKYKVFFDGGSSVVTINQNNYSNQWVSLGTFVFAAGNTGYVQLGDGTGIQGQYIAFDAVKWHKIGALDNTDPTVAVQPLTGWKTADFAASYTDSDNAGGSGVECRYYQVLENNGSEWRANKQNGFFNDNFETTLHTDWTTPAASGTWSISSGHLRQSDEVEDNSNIYAALTQNSSNEYLYQFSAIMNGSGTNRRCGLHFFSDDPTLAQRGNSYLVWFRADNDNVEIYKCVANALVLKAQVSWTLDAATWYDFKTTYNPVTGRIEVYVNDVLAALYIDPAPLTSGSWISLRNGNADVMFDDLKVRRQRSSSTNITVGAASTNDVRYQNTNPATPSCRINTIVKDLALNWSAPVTTDANIDWTAPADLSALNDGSAADIDTLLTQTIEANWSASADVHSGIARYYVAAGTSPGATDLIAVIDQALATSFSQAQTLIDGQIYYFSVYAENGAGLISGTTLSDGQRYLDVTGLDENTSGTRVSIFPNPLHQETMLTLSLEQSAHIDLQIVDITGRCVYKNTPGLRPAGIQMIRMNLEHLSCGSYFMMVTAGDEVFKQKIVVY